MHICLGQIFRELIERNESTASRVIIWEQKVPDSWRVFFHFNRRQMVVFDLTLGCSVVDLAEAMFIYHKIDCCTPFRIEPLKVNILHIFVYCRQHLRNLVLFFGGLLLLIFYELLLAHVLGCFEISHKCWVLQFIFLEIVFVYGAESSPSFSHNLLHL